MIFSEDFVSGLSEEPVTGIVEILRTAFKIWNSSSDQVTEEDYEAAVEIYFIFTAIGQSKEELSFLVPGFPLTGNLDTDYIAVKRLCQEVSPLIDSEIQKSKIAIIKKRIDSQIGSGFSYVFTEGDLHRVQTLLNELRNIITAADYFDPDHKRRLLKRLEQVQSELHKKVSDLDKFWGLVGDAGVVLGKFGTDAKPIFDRIREVTQIVWRTQSRKEELPSNTPVPRIEDSSTGSNEMTV